jgi:hypothetical protein
MFIIFNEAVAKAMRDNPYIPIDPELSESLTLTAVGATPSEVIDRSVVLTKKGSVNWLYEVNTGSGWTNYTYGTAIPLANGQSCKWRCKTVASPQGADGYVQFNFLGSSGNVVASGNCNSMLLHDFESLTSLDEFNYAFYNLFRGCSSLIRAPKLPATTLSQSCYYAMFSRSGLSEPPELPATTLAPYCYAEMFNSCSRLTQAPALPATTLAENCYSYMFSSCENLTRAPELPATALARHCYDSMLSGCSRLTQTPVLPASFVPLYGYQSMFERCRALSKVIIAATSLGGYAIADWLTNVAAMGDFYCDPNTNFPTDSASGIPTGWTIHDIADYPN